MFLIVAICSYLLFVFEQRGLSSEGGRLLFLLLLTRCKVAVIALKRPAGVAAASLDLGVSQSGTHLLS